MFTCVNGTVSCFCNKHLQIDLPFTRTLARDQRRGLLIAFPNEKYSLKQCYMYATSRSGSSIRLFVFSDRLYLIKYLLQLEITEDMLNRGILSHSVTACNNYIPAFLTFVYVKAKRRHM